MSKKGQELEPKDYTGKTQLFAANRTYFITFNVFIHDVSIKSNRSSSNNSKVQHIHRNQMKKQLIERSVLTSNK